MIEKRPGIRPNARIFSHADSFKKAAILSRDNDLHQPMAVNAALAIELYLKSFLAINIVSEKENSKYTITGFTSEHGHKFSSLINKIEQKDKELLFEQLAYLDSSKNWEDMFKKFEDVFINIRYWYETKNWTSIDYEIVDFAEILGKAVLNIGKIKER